MEQEEEDDFMSDKFLIPTNDNSNTSTLTYSDKRKRKQIESLTKSHKRSRAEQEIEAREEGLRKDLIANQLSDSKDDKNSTIPPTTHSKAVQMMLKMGFQPGKALGKQPTNESNEPSEPNLSKDPKPTGNQSHEAFSNHASSSQKPPLITPIEIKLRNGRGGIGTEKPTKARYQFSKAHQELTEDEIKAQKEFFEKSKSKFDIRKIESTLSKARRTCQELDLRNGIEENVLWLDPFSDEVRDEVIGLDTNEKRLKGLKDADEFENTVVSTEEEEEEDISDREEKASWVALDSASRLIYTLQYLRQEYFYCIWCGCQYDSLEELNQECPGEDEDDH